jgi:DNA-binding NtrC family response regulator
MNANKILVVDDEADIRRLLQEILREEGFEVEVAGNAQEARELRTRQLPDLVLLDIWMPDIDGITLLREWSSNPAEACPVVMMSGHGTVETAVEATRLGAFDFIEKPLSMSKLLLTVNRAMEARRPRLAGRPDSALATAPFGRSRVVQQFRVELTRLALVNQPLLLIGESGVEPESLARFVHQSGPRAEQLFVTLNGRALGNEQAAETLLGVNGEHPGLLQQAHLGTLYIGDVEDLPDTARRLLAGLLETGSVIGRNGVATPLDVRVVATVQPGAEQRIGSSSMARDFFAHLSALPLRVPSLRDYAEDVPELLRHTIDQLTEWEQLRFRRFTVAAQNRLRNYPWPDNLRELRNLVRRVLQRGGPEEVSLEEVERELGSQSTPGVSLVKQDLLALPLREAREHFERAYLTQQLQLCGGKVGQLAKRVGMERTHLYRKLRSLGIEIAASAED